jgi:hypothetical protein
MRINASNWQKVFKAQPCSTELMELLGFEEVASLFVDSSGFGQDNEPALTVTQFERQVKELVKEHGTLTAKITGQGMFQVYVGLFKKTGTPQAKRIASNTYLIDRNDGKRIVRLYDTDIITDNGNGTITLNSGGYNTNTTSKRMNEFSSAMVNRKNWEFYANGTKFDDNNTVTIDGHLRGVN